MSQTKPSNLNQEAAPGNRRRLPAILAALRPKQWVKNVLVAAAALFTSDKPRTLSDYIPLIVAILVFCLVSGCTYIINDIRDVDNDRHHPKKKLRPLPPTCSFLPPRRCPGWQRPARPSARS